MKKIILLLIMLLLFACFKNEQPENQVYKDQTIKITILNSWCEKEVFTFTACYQLSKFRYNYIYVVNSNNKVLFIYQNVKKNSYSVEYKTP